MIVEAVGPDGTLDEMQKIIKTMFPSAQEWAQDASGVLLLAGEGHIPTEHELSQIEDADWEWMRDIVDAKGSSSFSMRLTMLEEARSKFIR
jgi:hypothetical protein